MFTLAPTTPRPPRVRRGAALLTTVALLLNGSGCTFYKWQAVPLTETGLHESLHGGATRFATRDGSLTLRVIGLDYPYVQGVALHVDGHVPVRVPRARVHTARLLTEELHGAQVLSDQDWRARTPVGQPVELRLQGGGRLRLHVDDVDDTHVSGNWLSGAGLVELDLRRVSGVEVREVDTGKTLLISVGGTLAVLAGLVLVVLMTKESCPIVYVDRGQGLELVGEAYAGAAFRSIQRDDLLPLPGLPAGRVRVRLRDEAHETQYTDRAELVLVEHAPDVRVLSDHTQQVRALTAGRPALRVRDGRGHDVGDALASVDGRLWQTDMDAVAREQAPELAEHLEAEFEAPPPGALPVLEFVGGNTPWIDLVFGRFFAAHGRYLPRLLERGNEPESAERIRAWRAREGLDLAVDVQAGAGWRELARVPTAGPMALRQVAVPLPRDAMPTAPGARLRLRLRAGLGFWRFDQLALATELPAAPLHVQTLAPSVAQAADGSDARALLAHQDGRYDALREVGDTLELGFDLLPVSAGQARSAFLSTNGYYNVRAPAQTRLQRGTLRALHREPRSLSRLSLDLARAYRRLDATTPHASASAAQP